jgi:hypothetical protein
LSVVVAASLCRGAQHIATAPQNVLALLFFLKLRPAFSVEKRGNQSCQAMAYQFFCEKRN